TENSGSEKYDGTEKTVTGYTVTISNPLYTEADFTFNGNDTVKGTDAGTYEMQLKPADFTNISENFTNVEFVIVDGKLEITKRAVTLTSATDQKVYDGTALTNDTVTVGGDGFASGEGATYNVTGTQTEEGSSANTFTYTLKEGTKADNYTITTTEGTLTVTAVTDKVTVTITENSGSEKYDGTEKTVTGYTVTISNPLYTEDDFTFSGNDTVKGTDAGSYPMELKPADFTSTSENFTNVEFVIVDGKLEIAKRTVTLTSGTSEKEYDGTPLTNSNVAVTGDGWATGEGATYNVTGTQTVVGSSANTFTYTLNQGTKADNYTITTVEGTLTVKDRTDKYEIEVVANSNTGNVYDGSEKSATGFETLEFTVNGQKYTVEGLKTSDPKSTDVVTVANAISGTAVVKDAAGNDVTSQFTVTTTDGELEITKRPVTITTGSAEKEYDGTALTSAENSQSGFATGESVTVTNTGSQTEVGKSDNTCTVAWDKAKESNYEVTYTLGKLEVTKTDNEVTLTAASAEKVYDGTPLTDATVTATGLPEGFTVEATASGSQTVAGSTDNVVNDGYVIKDANGNDVTDNFTNITTENGTLTVTAKALTITADSNTKIYDGTPLTDDGYTNTELAKGDEIKSVTVTGSQTVVGSSDNVASKAKIVNADGDDVTASYDIKYVNGTLEVTKKTVTITADSDTKVYDGTALTKNSYTNTDLAEGDEIKSVTVTGSQTNVGKSDNVPSAAKIVNADGDDVTASYDIKYVNGSLEVTKRSLTITAATDSKTYDGTPLTNDGYEAEGLAEGDEVDEVTVTGSQTKAGSSDNVPSDAKIVNADGDDVTANYDITYVNGTLTVAKKGDVVVTITEHSGTYTYDGTEKTVTGYDVSISTDLYTENDFTFSGTDSVSGTEAGTYDMELKASDFTNINDDFETVTFTIVDGTLKIDPLAVTITAASDTKVYDGTALTNDGYTNTDLAKGDKIDSVTVTGSQTNVGKSDNVASDAKIVNADGKDVTASYDITYVKGSLEVTKKAVTVTAASDTKVYDGTPLTNSNAEAEGLAKGDTMESVTVTGSQTVVGTSANVPSAAKFVNADGDDVTANYDITYTSGTLEVTQKELTITANSDTKVYDGTPLTNDGYTNTDLAKGDKIDSVTVTGSQTVAGSSDNVASDAKIVNADGDDVTASYKITYVKGTLEVTQKELTVTAASDTKVYDGTPLTNSNAEATGLAEGDKMDSVTVTGSQTVAGSSDNTASDAKIVNAAGDDVTASYKITYVAGILEVTKRDVTITAASDEKVYDGKALTNDGFTADGLAEGDTATATVIGSQTNAGESPNVASDAKIVNAAGDDVTASYNITYVDGTLKVTPYTDKVTVTITGNSDTETYDGTEKIVEGYTVSIDNELYTVDDFTFSGNDEASGTTAGEYEMGMKPGDFQNISENFTNIEFVVNDGILTIEAKAITITAASDEKVYDGKALTNDDYTVETLAEGDKVDSIKVEGSQTNAGSSDNVPSEAKIVNAAGDDVTSSYDITYVNGTLTVTPYTDKITVTINGNTDEVEYDGHEHTVEGYTVDIDNDLYTEDDFEFTGNDVARGTRANNEDNPEYNMGMTSEDFKNISENFTNIEFVVNDGSLIVDKRPIIFTSATDEKTYDGTPLTNDEVTITGDGLADTDTVTFDVTGSQTLVGTSKNTFDYEFGTKEAGLGSKILGFFGLASDAFADDEDDVAANYEVTKVEGDLTVTDDEVPDDKVVKKTHDDGETYGVGDTVVFTIEVTNIYDEAKDITVTEQPGVTIIGKSEFKDVEPGATITVTAEYTVTEEDIANGSFSNTVEVSFDGERDYTGDDEVDKFGHLTVEKTVTNTPKDGKVFRTGETIKYKIVVTNDGTQTMKNIVVKDELTGDEWTIKSLKAGQSKTFKAEYVVTKQDGINGKVTNVATAEGEDPDGDNTPGDPGEVTTKTDKPLPGPSPIPKTGDTTQLMGYMLMMSVGMLGLILVSRRKKERA
ncbi:MAG: LPXTG cell wall anchor domain-containing protein, partial [Prevotella sp.]|nr:LPXTG cell wall anchor domain-containing protein [Prevotella sp.]